MGILAGRYENEAEHPPGSRAALRGGIYSQRVTARGIAVGKEFVELARRHGISPAQLAVLWVKDQPGVTAPLIGPRTLEQLEHYLPVLDMNLSPELREACDQLVPPGSAAANFHNSAGWMKMHLGETVVFETSKELWKLIEQRRKEPTISGEELEKRLSRERPD
jgi:hypothetical protein